MPSVTSVPVPGLPDRDGTFFTMSERVDVLWLSAELGSAELCNVRTGPGNPILESTTLLSFNDLPARIDYTISTNVEWETQEVRIELSAGGHRQAITLERDERGWAVDGSRRPDLDACIDVDLGWTPATNMLPLRRNPLDIGHAHQSAAAWVRFPELDVVVSEQLYTRLASDRFRYQSSTFEAELLVTSDGVVTDYGDGLWRAAQLGRLG